MASKPSIYKRNFLTVPCSSAPFDWNGQCVRVTDSSRGDLPYNGGRANNRTPANCIALCREKNYKFAGVQDGSQCYCGKAAPKTTTSGAECDYLCPGDSSKKCGGNYRMNVYSTTGRNAFSLIRNKGTQIVSSLFVRLSVCISVCLSMIKTQQ